LWKSSYFLLAIAQTVVYVNEREVPLADYLSAEGTRRGGIRPPKGLLLLGRHALRPHKSWSQGADFWGRLAGGADSLPPHPWKPFAFHVEKCMSCYDHFRLNAR